MRKFLAIMTVAAFAVLAASALAFADDAKAMYRMYNPNSGEHFYTAEVSERDTLIQAGWNYEGVGWMAPQQGSPVYRLYNANGGEHHYTLDENEKNSLVSIGWNDEGIGWQSDTAKAVPLFREYNPNAFANNHNYTADKKEHEWLLSLGWNDEGVGWHALDTEAKDPNPLNAEDIETLKLEGWWQSLENSGSKWRHITNGTIYTYYYFFEPSVSVLNGKMYSGSYGFTLEKFDAGRSTIRNSSGYKLKITGNSEWAYWHFDDEQDIISFSNSNGDASSVTASFKRNANPPQGLLDFANESE